MRYFDQRARGRWCIFWSRSDYSVQGKERDYLHSEFFFFCLENTGTPFSVASLRETVRLDVPYTIES